MLLSSRAFGAVVGVASLLLLLVGGLVIQLAREDAVAHMWGFVQQMCTSITHVAMDLTSVIVALAALTVGVSLVLAALATSHATSLLVRSVLADQVSALPGRIVSAATRAGVSPGRVDAFRSPDLVVFVHGYSRSRIAISSAVSDALTDNELTAVLAHEAHHLQKRDPLRRSVADVLARGMFMFPVVAELRDHFLLATEIDADRSAMQRTDRGALAGAILKFAGAPHLAATPAMTSHPDDAERVAQILHPDRRLPSVRPSRSSVAVSTVVALTLVSLGTLLSFFPSM